MPLLIRVCVSAVGKDKREAENVGVKLSTSKYFKRTYSLSNFSPQLATKSKPA